MHGELKGSLCQSTVASVLHCLRRIMSVIVQKRPGNLFPLLMMPLAEDLLEYNLKVPKQ